MIKFKEISIEITYDCALECIYCSSSAKHNPDMEELDIKYIKSILSEAKECGAIELSISGGEPFLHSKFYQIIEYATVSGFKIKLYTSGVIFDNQQIRTHINSTTWNKLKQLSKNNIVIIFDLQGVKSKIVDSLMGIEGAFAIITESIKNALSCNIKCEAHVIPMIPNFNYLFDIADFAEKIGLAKLSFLRFVPQGRGSENIKNLLLSPNQFIELQYIMLRLQNDSKERKRNLQFRLGDPINFTFLFDHSQPIIHCRGGIDAPLILPNGDVHMCPAWKNLQHLKAGNITEKSLITIWESSPFYMNFRKFIINARKQITGACKDCAWLIYCKGGCTAQRILFNGNNIPFPCCMNISPDPLCPLINNISRRL